MLFVVSTYAQEENAIRVVIFCLTVTNNYALDNGCIQSFLVDSRVTLNYYKCESSNALCKYYMKDSSMIPNTFFVLHTFGNYIIKKNRRQYWYKYTYLCWRESLHMLVLKSLAIRPFIHSRVSTEVILMFTYKSVRVL